MTDLQTKLSKIQLIVLDVDGVLTDGSITYSSEGEELKTFHSQDGFGITLGRQAGLKFGVITGRVSPTVERRVKELKFDYYQAGHFYKQEILATMISESGLKKEQVLYAGDEILDLVCQPLVGVFTCPCDAVNRVLKESDWCLQNQGGRAAVREIIDGILSAQNRLTEMEDFYIQTKKETS